MKVGVAQADITPPPGVELSGFASRIQPSIGVLDDLYAKALYLDDGHEQLLWIHCDLIGFDQTIVDKFRHWALNSIGIHPRRVMLSATHTHAGPCTIHLSEAGTFDPSYVEFLLDKLRATAVEALSSTLPADCIAAEGRLALARDRRRNTASAHTDPRVFALGFRRPDGPWVAVVANYAMHPVALGHTNRFISADVPGQAALSLQSRLAGKPVVLMTNGACGNLNPPAENVPFAQIVSWGQAIANAVEPHLVRASVMAEPRLLVAAHKVKLPLEQLDERTIDSFALKALRNRSAVEAWGEKYRRVVENWRQQIKTDLAARRLARYRDVELFGVSVGHVTFLGVNAEVFSEFVDWLPTRYGTRTCVVTYANGYVGYLATRTAYAEGGYEVDVAPVFYGGLRPAPGSLELLATHASELLARL